MASKTVGHMDNKPVITSLLDTDLYKLTMQCCVLKYYKDVHVTYSFTNRTPHMKLSRAAFEWLRNQINQLSNLAITDKELSFLRQKCGFFMKPSTGNYLEYLKKFRLRPSEQIKTSFNPTVTSHSTDEQIGDVYIHIAGSWCDTILYEIPLLALISEAYFKFCDTEWSHDGQVEKATGKGKQLLEAGCVFSEFGTRRRRDYHTQKLVIEGLLEAQKIASAKGWKGVLSGTSNVHFAEQFDLNPIGTVAHEWFMGVAAFHNDYENATEMALQRWVGTFGEGVLAVALTDTFGTPAFLRAFTKSIQPVNVDQSQFTSTHKEQPVVTEDPTSSTYAQVFTGVRQDSGDPLDFVKMMRIFYDEIDIKDKKTIVFSDSLNIELCLKYKKAAEASGFQPTFGVGTFLTNDFENKTDKNKKSVPLNIVIKIASVEGRNAVKISDNIGKNTGNQAEVDRVKRVLGYEEKDWSGGDESKRWGSERKS
ncbi:nicotinate phosphoribosyltransferase [Pseudovirgaria hyperparasitica]|uniref:nicotinate phosphoribosyltransferase n=1 Tax=Pseudovirgaria hyperparasitica TaxID=470096 RepID=A0A6A6VWL5_9PEZI|nr:nicotinate phosphoribosyltransferase [Pseudovirgaria hyperparasitica]KAF2755078.1 nicotinate phosphoribosyltransferase [Pseudovirgaria hyperparasitica]